MSKLQEIIDHYVPPTCQGSWYREMMIEYAEYYAKKCLEIASENAVSITDIDKYIYGSIVDTDSILNIKLPDHE